MKTHINLDPLHKPDDWEEPRNDWDGWDFSKVPHYHTDDGLEYWVDIPAQKVRTNDPDIFLSVHSFGAFDYVGHSYAKLHFDGGFVTLTTARPDIGRDAINFFADNRGGPSVRWMIEGILRSFELPDNETHPWIDMAGILPVKKIEGMTSFRNQAQQDRFIFLTNALLSCFDGAGGGVLQGERMNIPVHFSAEIERKFKNGSFISTPSGL